MSGECDKCNEHCMDCKCAGVPNFDITMFDTSDECVRELQLCIKQGWKHVQGDCRPDESFRAMLRIMIKWMAYIEAQKKRQEVNDNIWDVMKSRGLDPTKAFPMSMINRLQDIGRAQQLLKSILDSEIFENLSKHSMFWHSDRCVDAEKLDDIRGRVVCLNDNLWDLWRILRMEEEE